MLSSLHPDNCAKNLYIGAVERTPLGSIWVAVSEDKLTTVVIGTRQSDFQHSLQSSGFWNIIVDHNRVVEPLTQLSQYLDGKRQVFNLSLDWSMMTSFQRQVLKLVYAIPYGDVLTYGEIAHRLGKPGAARAVGRANATNPMPLVIPCHRVVGSDGKLHGYGAPGGVATKAWLLELERGRENRNHPPRQH